MTELVAYATDLKTVDERVFRHAMAHLAKCVAITTTLGPDGPSGCTTTSMISLSLNPPSLLLALGTWSRTLGDLRQAGRFAVNMLSGRQHDLVAQFAQGSPEERFRGVPYTVDDGVPIVTGSTTSIVCELDRTIDVLDHTLVVGTVRALHRTADGPLILVNGRPHPTPIPFPAETS